MQIRKVLAVVTLATAAGVLSAQQPADQKPDNTGVNKRDRQKDEPTADQQKNSSSDLDLSKSIRRALGKDKSLSTYAHNVKVIADHGTVTLKGPVRSEDEKHAVEAKAAEIAGRENVKSELSVAPKGDNH